MRITVDSRTFSVFVKMLADEPRFVFGPQQLPHALKMSCEFCRRPGPYAHYCMACTQARKALVFAAELEESDALHKAFVSVMHEWERICLLYTSDAADE